ncbi:glycosyl hydrolase family 18 [Burkholderia contaminans FFH2055]|uniref:HlyD family secretion protein n=1 Tax=Burkholderia contaminans TaxID=488447 RepID=UPI0006259C3F|nr:biotin/lipoyl-binding protein [Burkholderia contaminans]KKL35375.1 glycosyl hydrolase family 18 [Burkholderia contaminans FFH2055]MEB4639859.1 biotin/lipoyl-binding protein [Burkholderia contaminans]MEB4654651.1 biotin/lipoyl-binding protein [Burkholderia contaminans]MEB4659195.1 biotin/lipoyl-binding protein [Burkholderia contaminans]MEB4669757.1 biotin/lipoyl-binding protein [Burkholderia contaminans]
MKHRLVFVAAVLGFLASLVAAWVYSRQEPPQPPVFKPAANPYARGVYANGIVESEQPAGANVNVYPDVTGAVTRILVHDGDPVKAGDALLTIDDSVQRATAAQLAAQADAAAALLDELKAQPRREVLDVASAQTTAAQASLKLAQDQYDKQRHAYDIDPKAVSRDALDTAANAVRVAAANLDVVMRQYRLTKAGAWRYDVRNQEAQAVALRRAADAAAALLARYTLRAPADGTVLAMNAAVGSYLTSQGLYDTYTQGNAPVAVLGTPVDRLQVRCYIDEILIHQLPDLHVLKAHMFVRGTSVEADLQFVRVQPYVTPKIELSDQRTERVDVRVLPVIFRIVPNKAVRLFPGQIVDVYVAGK